MSVNSRGSLPPALVKAYVKAHRGPARKAPARKATGRKAPARTVRAAAPVAEPSAPVPTASPRLAVGLRGFLDAIDNEVRAVSTLSERIDTLVTELNALREEQANRLLMLDELQAEASDPGLTAFLTKAIRPRKTRVPEIVPDRLQ